MPSPSQIAALFGGTPQVAASLMPQQPASSFLFPNGFQGGLFGMGRPVDDWSARQSALANSAFNQTLQRTGNANTAGAQRVRSLVGHPRDNPIVAGWGPADLGAIAGIVKNMNGLFNVPIKNKAAEDVGQILGVEGFDSFTVHNAGIDDAASRGQGYGLSAYRELADHALASGKHLRSDTEVTLDAARMYEALAKRGYKIERNPNAKIEEVGGVKKWVAPSRSWGVFRVVGGPQ